MKHPLKVFFSLENRGRGKILIAVLYSFLNKLSDLAPPVLIGTAVDIVIKKESSFLGKFVGGGVMKQLWVLGGLTIFVWLLESIFEYLQKIRWRGLAQEIQHNFRMEGYNHLQKLDIGFFEYKSTGGLISLLNDDVNQFERFLNGGANDIVQVLTTVVIIGGGFFYMAPDVALFSFLPIPLILLFSFKFKDKVAPHYKKVREEVDALSSKLANNLAGISTIKSYTAESYESWALMRLSGRYNEANKKAIRLSSAFSPIIRMIIVISFTTTLIMGGWFVTQGKLSVGVYSVMVFLTQDFFGH